MNFFLQPLTLVTFFPLVGVLVILFLNREQKNLIRWVAMVTSLITFGISLWVLAMFNPADPNLQLTVQIPWITVSSWTIDYYLGVTSVPIAVMIICSLFIGSILGVVISLALVIKTRRNMAKLRRQIKETEQEVNNLRTLPIKDSH